MTKVAVIIPFFQRTGEGVNQYFSNRDWDGDGILRIVYDQMIAYTMVRDRFPISPADTAWVRDQIEACRSDLGFFSQRYFGRR